MRLRRRWRCCVVGETLWAASPTRRSATWRSFAGQVQLHGRSSGHSELVFSSNSTASRCVVRDFVALLRNYPVIVAPGHRHDCSGCSVPCNRVSSALSSSVDGFLAYSFSKVLTGSTAPSAVFLDSSSSTVMNAKPTRAPGLETQRADVHIAFGCEVVAQHRAEQGKTADAVACDRIQRPCPSRISILGVQGWAPANIRALKT